jgi:hypothetical protein
MNKDGYFHPETDQYKYWSQQDDIKLKELVSKSLPFTQIAKILNRSKPSCYHRSSDMGLKNKYIRRIYSINSNFWETPNLLNCYWAGLSAADCYISIRGKNNNTGYVLSLALTDKNHIEKFKLDTNFDGKIEIQNRLRKNKAKNTNDMKIYSTVTVKINNNKWGVDLQENFNIITKKSKRLRPPNLIDNELKLAYLIGYTDGDGCICLTDRKSTNKKELVFRYVSASYDIIYWLKDLIDTIFPKKLYSRRNKQTRIEIDKNNKYFSFAIIGMRALVLYDYLKNVNVPKMDRKWFRSEILAFLEDNKQKYPQYFLQKPEFSSSHPQIPPVTNNS